MDLSLLGKKRSLAINARSIYVEIANSSKDFITDIVVTDNYHYAVNYRAKIYDQCTGQTYYSEEITIEITQEPSSEAKGIVDIDKESVCLGEAVSLSIRNYSSKIVTWEKLLLAVNARSIWTEIEGSNGDDTITDVVSSESENYGARYRAKIANFCTEQHIYSDEVSVNIGRQPSQGGNGTISVGKNEVCRGEELMLQIKNYDGRISLWEKLLYSSDGSVSWVEIGGSAGRETITDITFTESRFYRAKYRVMVYNACSKKSFPSVLAEIKVSPKSDCINYVHEQTILVDQIYEKGDINLLSRQEKSDTWTYLDGLGRRVQVMHQELSPNKKNIVLPVVYDAYGREHIQYLPYESDGSDKSYRTNAVNEALSFYTLDSPIESISKDSRPYTQHTFEPSPLNRIEHTYGPGEAWHTQDRKIGYVYRTDTENEVRVWTVNAASTQVSSAEFYTEAGDTEGHLFVTQTTDEENHRTLEYQNKLGQIVLKKVEADAGFLLTYYVYDDFNNLRVVIPPKASAGLSATGSVTLSEQVLKELCFVYGYDERNRMIRKQLPGAEPVEMIYDKRDRLVLTQDGNQRNDDEATRWTFTKYDGLNRPIITGIYLSTDNRETLQSAIDAAGASETRTDNSVGYTLNGSFPATVSGADLLTVTYYDNYAFTSYASWDAEGLDYTFVNGKTGPEGTAYPGTTEQLTTPTGQVTGGKTKVFGQNTWLNSVVYYDMKYRPIQSVQENLLAGTDRGYNHYDFRGKLLSMLREHTAAAESPITYEQTYQYDHAERLLSVTHQLDGDDKVTLSQHEYNALGELIDKQLHSTDGSTFKQSVDYRYNIRGWLTHINNSGLDVETGINDEDNDYFGMELHYEKPVDELPTPSSLLNTDPTTDQASELIREADQLIREQHLDRTKPTSQIDSLSNWLLGMAPPEAPDETSLTAGLYWQGTPPPPPGGNVAPSSPYVRVQSGLQAEYVFNEGSGSTINGMGGINGTNDPLNLTIADPANVTWLPDGGLQVNTATTISSGGAASKIISAAQTSNELTLEAWVQAATIDQRGPARIISLSQDGLNRNATLGHQYVSADGGYYYVARLRTDDASVNENGLPELRQDERYGTTAVQHVVYTRASDGTETIYVDGLAVQSGTRPGSFTNWADYPLLLANENSNDRPWLGTYYLVAV